MSVATEDTLASLFNDILSMLFIEARVLFLLAAAAAAATAEDVATEGESLLTEQLECSLYFEEHEEKLANRSCSFPTVSLKISSFSFRSSSVFVVVIIFVL